jgi:hypothetical protein
MINQSDEIFSIISRSRAGTDLALPGLEEARLSLPGAGGFFESIIKLINHNDYISWMRKGPIQEELF